MSVHVFGIRHHGPGSARSLRRALDELQPDAVLVEGPPDAESILPLAGHVEMKPPVAILVYSPTEPKRAVYYPFVRYSPEWQAIQHGLRRGIPVRFIDLPLSLQLGAEADEGLEIEDRGDPLRAFAQAAGLDDSEDWWERAIEHREDDSAIFEAVLEAITALREKAPPLSAREERREAHMRQRIRDAEKEGFAKIAVVCGAWHAPALVNKSTAKQDAATLKGLPKTATAAAWAPWTNGRMLLASGYGAGVASPGWYDHLWSAPDHGAIRWVSTVASLLRAEDLDASSAHVIETVRLAEALAALRHRSAPSLNELNEAVHTVMLFANPAPFRLIQEKLIVGETLGTVPEEAPAPPLQRDLQAQQKRLRLPPEASSRLLDLDLRKEGDRERSRLLHRLQLLEVHWGISERGQVRSSGTFHEVWRLQWQPEFVVSIIAAAIWGNTVEQAASTRVIDLSQSALLPQLTNLASVTLRAELPTAAPTLLARIEAQAALTPELSHLMAALPELAKILRYGDVRQTDTAMVRQISESLLVRISIGLPAACASLDDDAAQRMSGLIGETNQAALMLDSAEKLEMWQSALRHVADLIGGHGQVAGRCARLLFDARILSTDDAGSKMQRAFSQANEPSQAAAWLEGFLEGSGLLLLHDDAFWKLLDDWVRGLAADIFTAVLPLLARTFARFNSVERRQMGERARRTGGNVSRTTAAPVDARFDLKRAEATLPLLAALLGKERPQ